MVRLAADDGPEARNPGEAARAGAPPRGERQLERPGDLEGVDRGGRDAAVVEALDGPVGEPLRKLPVERADADRELPAFEPVAFRLRRTVLRRTRQPSSESRCCSEWISSSSSGSPWWWSVCPSRSRLVRR